MGRGNMTLLVLITPPPYTSHSINPFQTLNPESQFIHPSLNTQSVPTNQHIINQTRINQRSTACVHAHGTYWRQDLSKPKPSPYSVHTGDRTLVNLTLYCIVYILETGPLVNLNPHCILYLLEKRSLVNLNLHCIVYILETGPLVNLNLHCKVYILETGPW